MEPTFEKIKAIYQKHNYFWSDKINIFGIRLVAGKVDAWDDLIGVCFHKPDGSWFFECYIATTEPGSDYLIKPMNLAGTAIVAEGQHKNVWTDGFHQGRLDRPALVQCGPFKVFRDNNRNDTIELTHLETAKTGGINLHWSYAPSNSNRVKKSSAGCQVTKNELALLKIVDFVKQTGLPTVTYTLFNSGELLTV